MSNLAFTQQEIKWDYSSKQPVAIPVFRKGSLARQLVYNPKNDRSLDFKPGENPLSNKTLTFDEIISRAEQQFQAGPSYRGNGRSRQSQKPLIKIPPYKKTLGDV